MNTETVRTVLVTGAGGGMGSAISKRMASLGWRVLGIDLKFPEGQPGNPQEFSAGSIRREICDVTDSASVDRIRSLIETEIGELDAAVSTAGIYDLNSLVEMNEEQFLKIFNVNLFGVYRINRMCVPLLRKGGRIVIVSSELAAVDPLPFTGVYAVTKAALEKYAYSLRMEVNLLGIGVSVIRPGAVDTGILGDSQTALERFCKNTKLYPCNAGRFQDIVNRVEAKKVSPEKVADRAEKALTARHPKLVYNLNRNPLLRLLNMLPDRLQLKIIGAILKTK